jgi:predicted nucleic-acid-binding Zn-ribbon protein
MGTTVVATRSERIVETLKERGAVKPCPRCGTERFEVVAETSVVMPGGVPNSPREDRFVPVVMIACKNCGWLSQHALVALGMMPEGYDAD